MIRYTTPTLYVRVKGVDLTGGYKVWVSLRQGLVVQTVEVTSVTLDASDTLLECDLTQRQTAKLTEGKPVDIQVNWVDRDGHRDATTIVSEQVVGNLLTREVSYE